MTGPQIAALQHLVRDMQAAGEHLRIVYPSVFVPAADFVEARGVVEAMLGPPEHAGENSGGPYASWGRIVSLQIGAAS